MKHIIFKKSGNSYIKSAILLLAITMVFSAVLKYAEIMTIIGSTKENTQRILDSFLIDNAIDIYDHSIRNGNSKTVLLQYSDEYERLIINELSLDKLSGLVYYVNEKGDIIYYFNSPLNSFLNGDVLELVSSFQLAIPVSLAGEKIFDMTIPLEVKSVYVYKQ